MVEPRRDFLSFLTLGSYGKIIYLSGCDVAALGNLEDWLPAYVLSKIVIGTLIAVFLIGNVAAKLYIFYYKWANDLALPSQPRRSFCLNDCKYSTIGFAITCLLLLPNILIIIAIIVLDQDLMPCDNIRLQKWGAIGLMITCSFVLFAMVGFIVKERDETFPIMHQYLATALPCLVTPHQPQDISQMQLSNIEIFGVASNKEILDELFVVELDGPDPLNAGDGGGQEDRAGPESQDEIYHDISGVYIGSGK